jgi:hypothetical protein
MLIRKAQTKIDIDLQVLRVGKLVEPRRCCYEDRDRSSELIVSQIQPLIWLQLERRPQGVATSTPLTLYASPV